MVPFAPKLWSPRQISTQVGKVARSVVERIFRVETGYTPYVKGGFAIRMRVFDNEEGREKTSTGVHLPGKPSKTEPNMIHWQMSEQRLRNGEVEFRVEQIEIEFIIAYQILPGEF